MKKFFTLMTLLVALCSGAWAATNTLLDKNLSNWSSADVTAWGADSFDPTYGLFKTGDNGSNEAKTTITPTPFSIITVEAEWIGMSNTGRSFAQGNYSYFAFGNIYVMENDQDKKVAYSLTGHNTAPTSFAGNGSWANRNYDIATKTYMVIQMQVNTATNTLVYLKVYSSDNLSKALVNIENQTLTNPNYTNIISGYFKSGKVTTTNNEYLKSIKVTEETQAIPTADYTVNYKLDGNVVKTETGNIAVGQTVNATAPFTENGQKYFFANGATTSFTVASGTNVFDVDVREAAVYNYSVKSNVGDFTYSDKVIEGDPANVPFPKYVLDKGIVYEKAANSNDYYHQSINVTTNNQNFTFDYSATSITDAVFYAECENIKGFNVGANVTRASNGVGAYNTSDVNITTLPAGIYRIHTMVNGNAGATYNLVCGNFTFPCETKGYNQTYDSQDFVITEPTSLVVSSTGTGSTRNLDYVLIEKTGDYVPATGVTVSTETPSINIMQNAVLTANVLPASATITDVKWESSNNNIATVDQSGVVTPITSGTVTIYATDHLGHSASQTLTITPLKALVAIKDAPAADAKVIVGATKDSKDQAANGEYVNVTSRAGWEGLVNTTQLNHEGSVWATEYNTSIYEIVVNTLDGDKEATKSITCTYTPDIQVEEMVMESKSQLLVEGGSRLTAVNYFPADATFKTAKWSSSNPSVAVVDAETGKVTAVSAGTCTITAEWSANAEHGTDISTSYVVTVLPKHAYDFFAWSDETMAAVKSDPMWISTDEGKSYGANFRNYTKIPGFLTANGKEIEELYGIKFLYPVEGQIGVAVNKGQNGENSYNGTQYLALNGMAAQMIIKNVKCGTQVVIGMESQYNEDYSQVQLEANGKMLTPVRIHEKEFAEYKWTVPGVAADGVADVVVRNYTSIGANIYYINCDVDHSLPLALPTAVETVESAPAAQPAKILTKTGIKVKGYGVDGK